MEQVQNMNCCDDCEQEWYDERKEYNKLYHQRPDVIEKKRNTLKSIMLDLMLNRRGMSGIYKD